MTVQAAPQAGTCVTLVVPSSRKPREPPSKERR
jgi:hypothetical protein